MQSLISSSLFAPVLVITSSSLLFTQSRYTLFGMYFPKSVTNSVAGTKSYVRLCNDGSHLVGPCFNVRCRFLGGYLNDIFQVYTIVSIYRVLRVFWCLAPSRLWCIEPALSAATPDHGKVGVFPLVSLRMFFVYQVA